MSAQDASGEQSSVPRSFERNALVSNSSKGNTMNGRGDELEVRRGYVFCFTGALSYSLHSIQLVHRRGFEALVGDSGKSGAGMVSPFVIPHGNLRQQVCHPKCHLSTSRDFDK